MLTVPEALDQLLAAATPVGDTLDVPVRDALNRVIAKPVIARTDSPAFDNSAMDGYALRLADLPDTGEILVVGRGAAGQAPADLQPGTAMRIFTGAPLPGGADTVCIQENCQAIRSGATDGIRILERPNSGANIRRRGEDFSSGQELIAAGTRLQPQHLGLASAAGNSHVSVSRRLRIAIFSSGDELVEPGSELEPGQIFNSNQIMLEALVTKLGCEISQSTTLPDSPEIIRSALREAARSSDLILTSGGVSVGEEDHLKAVVGELGNLDLWRIAVKPGKPLAFGSIGECGYLGLPGNPVSSFVTFCLFAAPYIRRRQGESGGLPVPTEAKALNDAEMGSREEYLRGKFTGEGVEIFSYQGSHLLAGLCQADCLVRRPAGAAIAAGDRVEFFPLAGLNL